jgi:hypothetical protein
MPSIIFSCVKNTRILPQSKTKNLNVENFYEIHSNKHTMFPVLSGLEDVPSTFSDNLILRTFVQGLKQPKYCPFVFTALDTTLQV